MLADPQNYPLTPGGTRRKLKLEDRFFQGFSHEPLASGAGIRLLEQLSDDLPSFRNELENFANKVGLQSFQVNFLN